MAGLAAGAVIGKERGRRGRGELALVVYESTGRMFGISAWPRATEQKLKHRCSGLSRIEPHISQMASTTLT